MGTIGEMIEEEDDDEEPEPDDEVGLEEGTGPDDRGGGTGRAAGTRDGTEGPAAVDALDVGVTSGGGPSPALGAAAGGALATPAA
jgi:hypothetical protein